MSTPTADDEIAAIDEISALFDIALPACPYPGLRSFEKEEWAIYFGREKATDKVVSKLLETQFVALHGDSGCGKSSLVRAGVLPRLERECARGGAMWRTTVMLPRAAPLWNLATALAELESIPALTERIEDFRRVLNLGADGAARLAEMVRTDGNDFVCILVDQFEELFQFADGANNDEAQHFIDVLTGVQRAKPPGLHIILTMRSEFLGECAGFEGLADTINETQYLLPRMEQADLIRALREPAQLYGGTFQLELAQQMIADAGASQDQLPLMQHAAMLLYRREVAGLAANEPWTLDLDDYKDTGGPSRLLSNHADEVFLSIAGASGRGEAETKRGALLRRVFQALTEEFDGRMVRRPQTLAQLSSLTGVSINDLLKFLAPLRAEAVSFIRIFASGPVVENQIVDISHEALMRNWERLQVWIHLESESAGIYRRLVQDTADYRIDSTQLLSTALARRRRQWFDEHQPTQVWADRYSSSAAMVTVDDVGEFLDASLDPRKREFELWREELAMALDTFSQGRRGLLTGPELEVARRYREEREGELTPAELAYIDKSLKAIKAAKAAAERTRKFFLWGSLGAAAVSITLAVLAAVSATTAEKERANAQTLASRALVGQSRALLGDGRPSEAMAYALAAIPEGKWKNPSPATRAAYVALLQANDKRQEILRIAPPEIDASSVVSIAWSSDGKQIISGHADGSIRTWNAISGEPVGKAFVLAKDRPPILSPDGKLALIIEKPVEADASAGRQGPDVVSTLSSSANGNTISVWQTKDMSRIATLKHDGPVNFATFSLDGTTILSTSNDLTARVWDAVTGEQRASVTTGKQPVYDALLEAAISPDGKWIVGNPRSGSYRVFEVATGLLVGEFRPASGWSGAEIRFNSKGDHVITAYSVGSKGHVKIWPLAGLYDQARVVEGGASPPVEEAEYTVDAFDGKVTDLQPVGDQAHDFIASSTDGVTTLWSSEGSSIVLRGPTNPVTAISRSPDAKFIVAGGKDATIRIWQIDPQVVPPPVATIKARVQDIQLAAAGDKAFAILGGADDSSDSGADDKSDRWLTVIDTKSGATLKSIKLDKPFNNASLEFGGLLLATYDSRYAFFDSETLEKRWEVSNQGTVGGGWWLACSTYVRRVVREKDGVFVIQGGAAGKDVRLVGSDRKAKSGEPDELTNLVVSRDGKKVFISWQVAGAAVWDVETGQQLGVGATAGYWAGVASVFASVNLDRIVVLGSDNSLVLWSNGFETKLATLQTADTRSPSVSFSASGRLILTRAGSGESTVLWRAIDGSYQATLRDSGEVTNDFAFSDGDAYAFSRTAFGSAKVWDAASSGELLDEIRGPSGPIALRLDQLALISTSTSRVGGELYRWPLRFGNNVEEEHIAEARKVVKALSPLTLSQRCYMSMATETECSLARR